MPGKPFDSQTALLAIGQQGGLGVKGLTPGHTKTSQYHSVGPAIPLQVQGLDRMPD